jgi:hypothetical protein
MKRFPRIVRGAAYPFHHPAVALCVPKEVVGVSYPRRAQE